jgi:hypothetical protein
MTVLPFVRRMSGGFDPKELNAIAAICAPAVASGTVFSVEWGATERGDPQAYFLGNDPEQDCVLCISRVGRRYIIEDGAGSVLAEVTTLQRMSERAARIFSERKAGLVARVAVAWYAAREFFEEKVEPAMAESVEVATHFAPQLAAFV